MNNRQKLDYIAYNLRRAAEERRKAAKTMSAADRANRLLIAEIFEDRADAALTAEAALLPIPSAPGELRPTLH